MHESKHIATFHSIGDWENTKASSIIQNLCKYTITELVYNTDELLWTTKVCNGLPQALTTDGIKGPGQVIEYYVQTPLLLLTFLLELLGRKHHVAVSLPL